MNKNQTGVEMGKDNQANIQLTQDSTEEVLAMAEVAAAQAHAKY